MSFSIGVDVVWTLKMKKEYGRWWDEIPSGGVRQGREAGRSRARRVVRVERCASHLHACPRPYPEQIAKSCISTYLSIVIILFHRGNNDWIYSNQLQTYEACICDVLSVLWSSSSDHSHRTRAYCTKRMSVYTSIEPALHGVDQEAQPHNRIPMYCFRFPFRSPSFTLHMPCRAHTQL